MWRPVVLDLVSKCRKGTLLDAMNLSLFQEHRSQMFLLNSGFSLTTGAHPHQWGIKRKLRDVGLERFDTVELFAKILLPATFLLACILQLHYFNEDFLKTTSLSDSPSRWESMSDWLKAALCKLQNRPSGEKEAVQTIEDKKCSASEGEWSPKEDEKLRCTAPAEEETSDWSLVIDKLTVGFLKLLEMVHGTQVFLWRILEIHVVKLVVPVVIWFTLQEVSLMNSLFYIVWVGALPYSTLRPHASRFSTVWACVIVICKMMYQLKSVVPSAYSSNCTEVWQGNSTQLPAPPDEESIFSQQLVDPAEWLGALRKCDDKVLPCLKSQLCILALMTLEVTVSLHQRYYRLHHQLQEPLTSTISDSITRAQLDEGLLLALKYFLNYGFYKFGLELCFVAALNAIGQRMDFYSLIHGIWLIYLLYLRRRKAIAEVWPRYCGFLVGLAIFQYFLCLGLPPTFCTDYPWRTTSTEIHSNLIKWLYLPDFAKKPDANLLLFDFLLLLAASLQWQVFVDENKPSMRMQAGDNVEISRDLRPEDIAQISPVPNFIFCRSYLDMVKVAIFHYHFWFVLCLVFLAGTTRINVLGAGYLVAFGYFMVQGSCLLLKPVKFILRPWDCLIGYSVLVVAMKTFLSVGACVYLEVLLVSHCWLVHSFGLYCTVSGYQIDFPEDESCELPEKEAGILWDAICFAFLLIQRRIFLSYYHLYVVADLVASKAIAPRGAEMLELSSTKAWERSEEDEKKSRLVINKQMEKIKAKQKKIEAMQQASRNPVDLAVGTHGLPREETAGLAGTGDDTGMIENEEEKKWWQPWVKHPSMVLDGSYSLFETDSEEEEAAEGSDAETKDHRPKPKTAFQLAHDAWTNSSRSALRMRRQDEGGMERDMREEERTQRRHSGGGERLSTCEAEAEAGAEHLDEPESRTRRLLSVAQFSWVLGKVFLDDITEALGNLSKESGTVMAALRKERCVWWRAVSKGKKTTTDNILRYCHSPVQETPSAAAPDRKEEGQVGPPGSKDLPASQELIQGEIQLPDETEKVATTGYQCRSTGSSRLDPPMEEQKNSIMEGAVDTYIQGSYLPQEYLRMPRDLELEQSDNFYRRLPRLVRLAFALYQVALSKSELLCYFMIILNHTLSASILTMIFPVLSFLWAMLSIPRPSRRFWMAAIYYTEATVMIKYFSQFGFLPWTTKRYAGISREKPFSLPNIIGIEKKDGYVLCDLLQLLVLFFHRSTMKVWLCGSWLMSKILHHL
ncbi:piezo-type mechanosensitive ion channel component 2-like [Erinaceus europaeus]|uniref:Piezo-type mechanosensitive ion channel component 2-like n=1 Tax=Erinaceus europaeus TaxID=9365 RepID=A0ABM3XT72_ERIEU|nr:piezo-type mechanosensitive ion channel component 2-like [Erinaceus europaeus]